MVEPHTKELSGTQGDDVQHARRVVVVSSNIYLLQ